MNRLLRAFLLFAGILACCGCSQSPPPESTALVGQISMNPGAGQGNLLLVHVTLNSKSYLFAVDTGTSVTTLDRALQSGLTTMPYKEAVNGAHSGIVAQAFEPPELMLDGQPLAFNHFVVSLDLSALRRISGEPIMGILGMDVLSKCRLRLDFENNQISFLGPDEQVSTTGATALEIQSSTPYGLPSINFDFLNSKNASFIIDTGNVGAGIISPQLYTQVMQGGDAVPGEVIPAFTQKGTSLTHQVRFVRSIELAGVDHPGLIFASGSVNTLGLRFFASYVATFDFPGHELYLVPIAPAAPSFDAYQSNMAIGLEDDKVMVLWVNPNGAAGEAGIKSGDQIISVDGTLTAGRELWQIRKQLHSPTPGTIDVNIIRKNQPMQIVIKLKKISA